MRPSGLRRDGSVDDDESTSIHSGPHGGVATPRFWPRTESPRIANERFGSYQVYEQLGTGGMASVHRAERRKGEVRQRVALKRLLPNAACDEELVALFLDEARLVSRLKHRNIAELYESGCVGESYFLAMELVAGPTLKQLLQRCVNTVGLIPFPVVLNLLCQICDGLAYAHELRDERGRSLGLIHRDVSPSNIVISSNGVVKLIDFGVAKTTSSHTQVGIIKGKLGYIAPEYLEGALDRRVDLWAIGVMAWELLTNRRLFSTEDDLETIRQVKSLQIDPPSLHNADVPPELDAIVMTALERDPDRRWQNAAALRTALLGVARPSSNAEVVEWVEWVCRLPATPVPVVNRPRPRGTDVPRLAEPIPRRAVEVPSLVQAVRPGPIFHTAQVVVQSAQVGSAMLQRRSNRRYLLPVTLIVLGGATAILAGMAWAAMVGL